MMRPLETSQDGRLYAIGQQGLQAFVDYLGGLRLSFHRDDGSPLQSMVLSSQETAGLRRLLTQPDAGEEPGTGEQAPLHRHGYRSPA
jgi:hypothetical protein